MNEFLISFVANLAADALLAVAVYLIVTQPGEKRKSEQRRRRALGLLKSEAMVNRERARSYISDLVDPKSIQAESFPLRYTRGAWNALRESGFLAEAEDRELAYYLFRMNEFGLIANKNLRRLELAHLENTGGRITSLGELARRNSEHFSQLLTIVLERLEDIEAVTIDDEHSPLGEDESDDEDMDD